MAAAGNFVLSAAVNVVDNEALGEVVCTTNLGDTLIKQPDTIDRGPIFMLCSNFEVRAIYIAGTIVFVLNREAIRKVGYVKKGSNFD